MSIQLATLNASPRDADSSGRKYFAGVIQPKATPALIYQRRFHIVSVTSLKPKAPLLGKIPRAEKSIFTNSARVIGEFGRNSTLAREMIHSSAPCSIYPQRSPSDHDTSRKTSLVHDHFVIPAIQRDILIDSARVI